mmetsp:Transcript_6847/g.17510  ORF Transcript_6847/g.17510 Transcript_6847/m.17510 type:complete len:276 (+) Transcript_6847:295-1122(+)
MLGAGLACRPLAAPERPSADGGGRTCLPQVLQARLERDRDDAEDRHHEHDREHHHPVPKPARPQAQPQAASERQLDGALLLERLRLRGRVARRRRGGHRLFRRGVAQLHRVAYGAAVRGDEGGQRDAHARGSAFLDEARPLLREGGDLVEREGAHQPVELVCQREGDLVAVGNLDHLGQRRREVEAARQPEVKVVGHRRAPEGEVGDVVRVLQAGLDHHVPVRAGRDVLAVRVETVGDRRRLVGELEPAGDLVGVLPLGGDVAVIDQAVSIRVAL